MLAIIIILELLGATSFYAGLVAMHPEEMERAKCLGVVVAFFWPLLVTWYIVNAIWSLKYDKSDSL